MPTKGNLRDCRNWQGIALLFVAAMEKRLRQEQAVFRKDIYCADHIATLGKNCAYEIEWNAVLFIAFVCYEKGFDSIDRTVLR